MSNEEKKQMQMVKDLVLAIAKSIELSSPKDEAEHQTLLVTGVVTYLNQWLRLMGADKNTKLAVIQTFAVAVMHAADIIEKQDGDDVSDEDVN